MPTTTATTSLPDRTFGVEIEFSGISRSAAVEAVEAVPGVSCELESYNHQTRPHWKVVTDCSVRGGGELVSPVLSGEAGIEELRKVVRAMANAGARVNRTCGLHVHVGVGDLTPAQIATVVSRYGHFETEIDAFMPPSRRADNNQYCGSIRTWARRLIERTTPVASVRDIFRSQPGRQSKVNLMAYDRQKTIEFRQHSGTCNASKIENWVRFLLYFVEVSRSSTEMVTFASTSFTDGRRATGNRRSRMDAKLDLVLLALRERPNGLTVQGIAMIGGWNPSSVPAYVSRLRSERGAVIRKGPVSGCYRLFSGGSLSTDASETVNTSTRRAARTVNLTASDSLFRGVPREIAGFYHERTAEMSGVA